MIIQSNVNLYLFTCLLKSPKANYKVNTSERRKHNHTKIKKGNLHHLDNNDTVSVVTKTIVYTSYTYIMIIIIQIIIIIIIIMRF
jgi:hypothetical protein